MPLGFGPSLVLIYQQKSSYDIVVAAPKTGKTYRMRWHPVIGGLGPPGSDDIKIQGGGGRGRGGKADSLYDGYMSASMSAPQTIWQR
mmetsp:Transcript_43859/g.53052  ORF Transcript_43859/g.53052 Transcript_43859/m.53052 type:complete len:87 (-) Transcript_43859:85-345(-)